MSYQNLLRNRPQAPAPQAPMPQAPAPQAPAPQAPAANGRPAWQNAPVNRPGWQQPAPQRPSGSPPPAGLNMTAPASAQAASAAKMREPDKATYMNPSQGRLLEHLMPLGTTNTNQLNGSFSSQNEYDGLVSKLRGNARQEYDQRKRYADYANVTPSRPRAPNDPATMAQGQQSPLIDYQRWQEGGKPASRTSASIGLPPRAGNIQLRQQNTQPFSQMFRSR